LVAGKIGPLVDAGDLDSDGARDVLVLDDFGPMFGSGAVLPFLPYSATAFYPDVPFRAGVDAEPVGDVDGNGVPDFLMTWWKGGYLSTAHGVFVAGERLADAVTEDQHDGFHTLDLASSGGRGLGGVPLGDLDGDGLGDVLVGETYFTGAQIVAGVDWSGGLALPSRGIPCDLDGDGLPEIVGDDVVSGAGLAAGAVEVIANGYEVALCLGDLDGDGRSEFLAASFADPLFSSP
jgi:hypothetical protein